MESRSDRAWNIFVFSSRPARHARGSDKWAAAMAIRFYGEVNSGGINAFLTNSWDVDAGEMLDALKIVGALTAATEFGAVLAGLGAAVPSMSQDERWELLLQCWTDDLDEHDSLTAEADAQLDEVLAAHVAANVDFYLTLRSK